MIFYELVKPFSLFLIGSVFVIRIQFGIRIHKPDSYRNYSDRNCSAVSFCFSFLASSCTDARNKLAPSLEYLLFKLVHNLGPETRNVKMFHEQEAVTRLFTALNNLQTSGLG